MITSIHMIGILYIIVIVLINVSFTQFLLAVCIMLTCSTINDTFLLIQ